MKYKRLDIDDLTFFRKIVGDDFIFTDKGELLKYSHDETEDLSYPPDVVIKPLSTHEILSLIHI